MIIVRQQKTISFLDETDHRVKTVVSEIQVKTVASVDEARQHVLLSYADDPDAKSIYATISDGTRFLKAMEFGNLHGFKKPGVQDVA